MWSRILAHFNDVETGNHSQATESSGKLKSGSWIGNDGLLNEADNIANGSVRNTPIWLGLHRYEGTWYSTWAPDDGGSPGEWSASLQRPASAATAGEVYVGLAHQSHNINPILNTAVFEGFEVGSFDADLGVFPTMVDCSLDVSGAGVTVSAKSTELGAAGSEDVDWEVRYVGPDVMTPGGLKADIYLGNNGRGIGLIDAIVAAGPPAGTTTIEQIHWESNSYTTTNAAGTNLFAQAVPGSFGGDQNDYGVNMTGEIYIPNDADRDDVESILFHDGVDATTGSYLGNPADIGDKVSFAHDFSDKIPAANFRSPQPEVLNSVAGTGQPENMMIADLTADTLSLQLWVDGALCQTVSARPEVASAGFTASDVYEVTLSDVGSGNDSDLDESSLSVTINGQDVMADVNITKAGTTTALVYTSPVPPDPYTNYTMVISGMTTAATGGDTVEFTVTDRSYPILDELRVGLPAPPNATVGWDYMEFDVVATLGGNLGGGAQAFIDAQTVISTAAAPTAQENQPYINHKDPDSNGLTGEFNPDLPFLLDIVGVADDQIAIYARTTVTIAAGEEGDYTFRVVGDDGYGLRVNGGTFTSNAGSAAPNELDSRDPSVAYYPNTTGNSNAFNVCNFPAAGDCLVEFFGFEGGGGAYQELSWAKGAFSNLAQSSDWMLIGDTSGYVGESRWGQIPVDKLPVANPGDAGWFANIYYDAAVNLTAGVHELHFIWWEGGGGAHFEVTSVPGVELAQEADFRVLSTTVEEGYLYVGAAPVAGDITYDEFNDEFTLTWNSTIGTSYRIMASQDLVAFGTEVIGDIPGTGSILTSVPFANPFPGTGKAFFRVEVVAGEYTAAH